MSSVNLEKLAASLGGVDALLHTASKHLRPRGDRFAGDEEQIALYIQRSKNQNVVCYRGTFDAAGGAAFDAAAPIDAYWLDIDPEYVEANRQKGKMDDRCELNLIDRTMAYGHSVAPPVVTEGSLTSFELTFVALSKRPMQLIAVPKKDGSGYVTVILVEIGGVVSIAERIYVKSTEPKHFWNLPSVEYVELFGVALESGAESYEKIVQ